MLKISDEIQILKSERLRHTVESKLNELADWLPYDADLSFNSRVEGSLIAVDIHVVSERLVMFETGIGRSFEEAFHGALKGIHIDLANWRKTRVIDVDEWPELGEKH